MGSSRIRLCLVASIECPVGDSAKTRQFASSDMLVNLMIQPVSSCCLRFQWYRLPALSLERSKMESSVYMGNGWFGYAVMLWVTTVNTYVCLQRVLVESSVHMGNGERLVLACCAAPDVCPERLLLESSVYMGNG